MRASAIDNATPLIQVCRPTTVEDIRRCSVAICHWATGLDAGPELIDKYLKLAGPGISKSYVRWPKYSGCGIVAEGIHRWLRVDAECLYRKYIPGTAISRAIRYMTKMGAWVYAGKDDGTPTAGAYVVMGCRGKHGPGEAYGGLEHVLTVTHFDAATGTVHSVDGGQVGPNSETILARERRWERRGGRPILVDVDDGEWRYVLGWGDIDRVRFRDEPITVPEGWQERASGLPLSELRRFRFRCLPSRTLSPAKAGRFAWQIRVPKE